LQGHDCARLADGVRLGCGLLRPQTSGEDHRCSHPQLRALPRRVPTARAG
jgi:hypothetical protein